MLCYAALGSFFCPRFFRGPRSPREATHRARTAAAAAVGSGPAQPRRVIPRRALRRTERRGRLLVLLVVLVLVVLVVVVLLPPEPLRRWAAVGRSRRSLSEASDQLPATPTSPSACVCGLGVVPHERGRKRMEADGRPAPPL
jgi:hypothetical protein